ncbi:MAG: M57 family metalloprotease [Myxococcota bacterium]
MLRTLSNTIIPRLVVLTASVTASGCDFEDDEPTPIIADADEITQRLLAAGYSERDIEYVDGEVILQGDMVIDAETFEPAQGETSFRHYRAFRRVDTDFYSTVCIDLSPFAGEAQSRLYYMAQAAMARWNCLGLQFRLHVYGQAPGPCDHVVETVALPDSDAWKSLLPGTGGKPGKRIRVGLRQQALSDAEVVMAWQHEIGHVFGLRHTDALSVVSCGGDGTPPDDTKAGVVWIEGTPQDDGTLRPSLMNACYDLGNPLAPDFTADDKRAIRALYGR